MPEAEPLPDGVPAVPPTAVDVVQSDAGARVAQPELDVGEVWGLGAHRQVYRPRPRNLDRP